MGPEQEAPSEPDHTAAFGQFREASGATSAEDQEQVKTAQTLVDHLMHVSAEELVLLHQVGIASIDTEMARRSLEATNASTAAIGRLQTTVESLHAATTKWTRWMTGLTIAVVLFAVALVGVMFALIGLTAVQVIIAIVESHG